MKYDTSYISSKITLSGLLIILSVLALFAQEKIILDEVTSSYEIILSKGSNLDTSQAVQDVIELVKEDTILLDSADEEIMLLPEEPEIILDEVSSDDAIILDSSDIEPIIVLDDEIILDEMPASDTLPEAPPLDKLPEQTFFAEADYPGSFHKAGIEGDVILELLVSDSGKVDTVSLLEGFEPTLDSNAIKAAYQFKFTPAEAGGQTVPVYIQYAYHYSLDEVAQEITDEINFRGTLLERGTRKPLGGVLVIVDFPDSSYETPVPFDTYQKRLGTMEGQFVEEGALVTLTDSLGQFSLRALPNGQINLRIPHAGYETFQTNEEILPGEATEATLFLRKVSYNDYEVTAYYKGEEKEVTRHQLTVEEIRKIPGLGGDAIKVVQALPGVARATTGGGAVVVRGSNTYDSKFYLDGSEIPLLYHFGGLKSTYNSEALSTIDFYPGGWGTSYGSAIGGVVDLKSRSPKEDRWHGIFDVSTVDASFLVEGPIGEKVSIMATARRSYFGEIVDAILSSPRIDAPLTVTPFYWDYVTRVEIKPNEKHTVTASIFGSFDSLQLNFDNADIGSDEISTATDGISQQLFFNRVGAQWEFAISENLKNSFNYYYLFQKSQQGIFGFAKWSDRLNSHQFRNNLFWQVSEKSAFNFGVNGYVSDYILDITFLDANNLPKRDLDTIPFSNIGVYANYEWRPSDKWLIIPGVRYDYFGELIPEESEVPSFRFLARYNFVENHTVKFATGTYSQPPQPQGVVIHPTWGEPDMPATKACQTVLGYEWQITDLLSLDVQGYFNYQWDGPRQQASQDIDPNDFENTRLWYPDLDGRTYGLEVMFRHNQSDNFFGWLAYSFARSERQGPYDPNWVLFDQDQTHNLQLLGSWKLPRNWEIGGRARFVTGNPTTPIDSTAISVNGHSYIPFNGIKNSTRVDPFFQVDFRAEKKIVFKRSILSIYLDIQNILYFAYKSPEFEFYDDFYEDKIQITLPIIPALGVRYEF